RFITSARSLMSPSPFGSSAKSTPSSRATPLHADDVVAQTLIASNFAPGATPLAGPTPAMMSDTCVPWPPAHGAGMADVPQSIGSGSGDRQTFAFPLESVPHFTAFGCGHESPTKSVPPITLLVGNSPSLVVLRGSDVVVP